MPSRKNIHLMVQAARMYYEEGLTQQAIADQIGLSRQKVSRLLNLAREEGIVQITIANPIQADHQLEQLMMKSFNLKYVIITPCQGMKTASMRRQIGIAGADYLIDELHESGRTFLIANHRMEELAGLLDEVWVLSDGRITGVHELDALRAQACRVTGRLKPDQEVPKGLPLLDVKREGPIASCAVLEADVFERLRKADAFESIEKSPLPVEDTMKLLLKGDGGRKS